MRTRLFVVCSSLALVPLTVHAQDADPAEQTAPAQDSDTADQAQDQGPPTETQEADVVPPASQGQTGQVRMQGGRESSPGTVHTVVKGDTLWDLSEQYLGTPWYWPKVWSYNPQIANPHWIYPGNQIRFYAAGEEGAARVAVATPEGGELAPPETMDDNGGLEVAGKIGYTAPPAVTSSHEGFVTPREVEEAGTIDHSPSEALMLSYPDTVYVRFNKNTQAKVGDTYAVFRTVKKVDHPVTGKSLGYLTEIVGKVRVTQLGRHEVTAQIVASSDEIRRGDKVAAGGEQLKVNVTARPNGKDLKGYVVSALVPYLTIMGEESKLLVDRGSADGVEPGNTFTIIRQTDPNKSILDVNGDEDLSLPIQDIATCMAVTVKEHVSTCVLVRSIKEVVPGDRMEMRTGNVQVGLR
jgi:LysM repeat protein